MQFCHVNLLAFGKALPPVVVTSAELEERLHPLYERLHLPEQSAQSPYQERRPAWQLRAYEKRQEY